MNALLSKQLVMRAVCCIVHYNGAALGTIFTQYQSVPGIANMLSANAGILLLAAVTRSCISGMPKVISTLGLSVEPRATRTLSQG